MVFHTNRSVSSILHLLSVFYLVMLSCSVRSMTTKPSIRQSKLVVHWFRHQDLRLHDNQALTHSLKVGDGACLPVFCFDPKIFGDKARTPFGNLKFGSKRAKFLLESVEDLRRSLNKIGCGLVVTHEEPAVFFDRLAEKMKQADLDLHVCVQEEVLKEEKDAVKSVRAALQKHSSQSKVEEIWGSTMYDLEDLPFDDDLSDMPDVFTPFRNKVEKNCKIGSPLESPLNVPLLAACYDFAVPYMKNMPSLEDLGYTQEQIEFANFHTKKSVMKFKGGETEALARVKAYIWQRDLLRTYFETRNGMLGADYSTKFSPWLAHGCLSPREVARQCREYEQLRVQNKSTYWVVFELLWRDYCKFFCLKHGNTVFFPSGTIGNHKNWSTYTENAEAWKEGRTGYPLVDANMRELAASGFMSNRGRQNVASFLAIDLNHDWRFGADWFESMLLDYDVYSNWYNWCAAAGQTGGRLNRFNIVKQSKDYDRKGAYVRRWCPELLKVPTEFVHEPWKMTQSEQAAYGCTLGVDYPTPIIPPTEPKYSKTNRGGNNRGDKNGKQRKKNGSKHNPHQEYEMKSLKQGSIEFK